MCRGRRPKDGHSNWRCALMEQRAGHQNGGWVMLPEVGRTNRWLCKQAAARANKPKLGKTKRRAGQQTEGRVNKPKVGSTTRRSGQQNEGRVNKPKVGSTTRTPRQQTGDRVHQYKGAVATRLSPVPHPAPRIAPYESHHSSTPSSFTKATLHIPNTPR